MNKENKKPTNLFQSIILLTISVFVLGACTDAPKQFKNESFKEPNWAKTPMPGNIPSASFKKEDSSDEKENELSQDELTDTWSTAEIIYGVGLRAQKNGKTYELNFETTLADSAKILPKQKWGPREDGVALYPSSFAIQWGLEDPRTPEKIILLNQFHGEIRMPEFGTLKMGRSLNASENGFKVRCEGDCKDFFRRLFNALDGQTDSFDCYKTKICQNYIQDDGSIGFITPKIQIFITKEDKVPYVIRLWNTLPQGKLDTYFDLTKGSFLIDHKDFNSPENVSLGESYETVIAKMGFKPDKNNVGTLEVGNELGGIYLGFGRTNFERSTKAPLPSDPFSSVAVWSGFTQSLLIDGKFVHIDISKNKPIELKLVEKGGSSFVDYQFELTREKPQLTDSNVYRFLNKFSQIIDNLTLQSPIAPAIFSGPVTLTPFGSDPIQGVMSLKFEDGKSVTRKEFPGLSLKGKGGDKWELMEPVVVLTGEVVYKVKEKEVREQFGPYEFPLDANKLKLSLVSRDPDDLPNTLFDSLDLALSNNGNTLSGTIQVEKPNYLGIKNGIPKEAQKDFVSLLADKVEANLPGTTFVQLVGKHQLYGVKNYIAMIVGYDESTRAGKYVQFSLNEQTGDLNSVSLGLLINPIDRIVVPSFSQPVIPSQKTLGGFVIGDQLLFFEVDRGRDEATLIYTPQGSSESIQTRVTFKEGNLFWLSVIDCKVIKVRFPSLKRKKSIKRELG